MPSNKTIADILNTIKVNGKIIHRSDSCKYLGIELDDKLQFKKHKLKSYLTCLHSKMQYDIAIYGTSTA